MLDLPSEERLDFLQVTELHEEQAKLIFGLENSVAVLRNVLGHEEPMGQRLSVNFSYRPRLCGNAF